MSSSQPELVVRPPREGENEAVLGVLNAIGQAFYGKDDMSKSELLRWFSSPSLDVSRDVRVAARDGMLTAYVDVDDQSKLHTRYWIDLRYDPDRAAKEDLAALLAWTEERSRSDAEAGAILRAFVDGEAELGQAALQEAGLRLMRHSYRMQIELDDGREVRWPDGIDLATFEDGEARAVYNVQMETFEDSWEHTPEPYDEWEHWNLSRENFDPSFWFIARGGGEIAGIALCRVHETEPDMGWVSVLGVRRPWRRRGLGRALLEHAFAEFGRRGLRKAGLGVDAESLTGAHRLYENAGMRVDRRFDIYEKPL